MGWFKVNHTIVGSDSEHSWKIYQVHSLQVEYTEKKFYMNFSILFPYQ